MIDLIFVPFGSDWSSKRVGCRPFQNHERTRQELMQDIDDPQFCVAASSANSAKTGGMKKTHLEKGPQEWAKAV